MPFNSSARGSNHHDVDRGGRRRGDRRRRSAARAGPGRVVMRPGGGCGARPVAVGCWGGFLGVASLGGCRGRW